MDSSVIIVAMFVLGLIGGWKSLQALKKPTYKTLKRKKKGGKRKSRTYHLKVA